MKTTGLCISLGVGIAAGAVTAMMLPKDCTARKLAQKCACKVEDAAYTAKEKLNSKLDCM